MPNQSQVMERLLKPNNSRVAWIVIFGVLCAGTAIGGGFVALYLKQTDVVTTAFLVVFGIGCIVWSLCERKRLSSLELTDAGINTLLWRIFPLPHLVLTHTPWTEVSRVGISGSTIHFLTTNRRLVVNTLLFEDHESVVKFINEHTIPVSKES